MRLLLVGITALSLFLVGCNEAKKSRGTANARGTRNNTGGQAGGTNATIAALECQTQDSWGLIYDSTGNQTTWMANVRLFAAASVNYEDVGDVSGSMTSQSTGISFCGRVCNSGASEIYIGIWDSFFVSPQPRYDSEISINIKDGGAFGGQITSRTPPTFRDQFGTITFQGGMSVPGGDATGTLVFQNDPAQLMGTIHPTERARAQNPIPLGAFKIKSDRLFRPGC